MGPEMLNSFEQAFVSKRSEKDQRNLIRKLLFNSGAKPSDPCSLASPHPHLHRWRALMSASQRTALPKQQTWSVVICTLC